MDSFPDIHIPALIDAMGAGGSKGVQEFINRFDGAIERLNLHFLAQRTFGQGEWRGKNWDTYIQVAEAAMAEALSQAALADDSETAARRIDNANVMSYNLAADLAPCWPGDTLPREQRHFVRGMQAADDCLRWRELLCKGAYSFSIAYWAKGVHQLALADYESAVDNFDLSLEHAMEFAGEQALSHEVKPGGSYYVILASGYLGLAMWLTGDPAGREQFLEAISTFRSILGGAEGTAEQKRNAQFGIDQLRWVQGRVDG